MPLRHASKAGLAFLALSLALMGRSSGEEPEAGRAGRLVGIFANLDADKDGVLDTKVVAAIDKPAFKKLLPRGDVDKDGRIDKAEFDALVQKVASASKADGKARLKKTAKKPDSDRPDGTKPAEIDSDEPEPARKVERARDLMERFRAQDSDKDGRLSREEFQGGPAAFDRLDSDGDGFLGKADLRALRGRRKAGGIE